MRLCYDMKNDLYNVFILKCVSITSISVEHYMECVRGNAHTHFVTQNVKIMFSAQTENVRCDQRFFCCKTSYEGTIGNRETAKGLPTICHDNFIRPK